MLPVTVRDPDGQFVTTLTRKDFRVFEDEREQPLADFAHRQVPADVVLISLNAIITTSSIDTYVGLALFPRANLTALATYGFPFFVLTTRRPSALSRSIISLRASR